MLARLHKGVTGDEHADPFGAVFCLVIGGKDDMIQPSTMVYEGASQVLHKFHPVTLLRIVAEY